MNLLEISFAQFTFLQRLSIAWSIIRGDKIAFKPIDEGEEAAVKTWGELDET